MILALVGLFVPGSWASGCCTGTGGASLRLASCDRLAVGLGVGGDIEYGGWSWDGAWSRVGDDGGGNTLIAATALGRLTPWLQAGLRIPLQMSLDQLDGQTYTSFSVGSGRAWLELETPGGWPAAEAPQAGLSVGLGVAGPGSSVPGETVAEVGARLSTEPGSWSIYGMITGRISLDVSGEPAQTGASPSPASGSELDLTVGGDTRLSPRARLGLSVGFIGAPGIVPSYAVSVGPGLRWEPSHNQVLFVSVRAAPPVVGFGRNRASSVFVSVDGLQVLAHMNDM